MKIVALDGNAVNPGDLSWNAFYDFGEFAVYPRTSKELVIERAKDANIILTNKVVLDAKILEQLKDLRYIGLLSTGYNVVDIDYCKQNNIVVCNIPSYSTYSVAQMTFALILEIAIGTKSHSDAVKDGQWSECQDFCFWNQNILELFGKTLGIVGYGQIGKQVEKVACALGMNVLVYARHCENSTDTKFCSLQNLLSQSDIISLHCPLNEQSQNMINSKSLSYVKKDAIIINTARGGLIDENDVAYALKSGRLLAYGADVLSQEPPAKNNPLFDCKNAIITPHIAWASLSARQRLLDIAVQNIKGYLQGNIQNCVYLI